MCLSIILRYLSLMEMAKMLNVVGFYALGVALVAAIGVAFFYASKKIDATRDVLIGKMIRGQNIDMNRVVWAGLEEDLAKCARSCLFCPNRAECSDRLSRDGQPEYHDICPNAQFIDRLQAA